MKDKTMITANLKLVKHKGSTVPLNKNKKKKAPKNREILS